MNHAPQHPTDPDRADVVEGTEHPAVIIAAGCDLGAQENGAIRAVVRMPGGERYPFSLGFVSPLYHTLPSLRRSTYLAANGAQLSWKRRQEAIRSGLPEEVAIRLCEGRWDVHLLLNTPGGRDFAMDHALRAMRVWKDRHGRVSAYVADACMSAGTYLLGEADRDSRIGLADARLLWHARQRDDSPVDDDEVAEDLAVIEALFLDGVPEDIDASARNRIVEMLARLRDEVARVRREDDTPSRVPDPAIELSGTEARELGMIRETCATIAHLLQAFASRGGGPLPEDPSDPATDFFLRAAAGEQARRIVGTPVVVYRLPVLHRSDYEIFGEPDAKNVATLDRARIVRAWPRKLRESLECAGGA